VKQLAPLRVLDAERTARPPAVLTFLRRAEVRLERFARHRGLACLTVAFVALGMRAALLPVLPLPTTPFIQDEFSYVLGGETFAMGRLANPPHPMWRFFETQWVNMHPAYVSKYPPGQAAFLALGIRLFGHPWFGVWLSMGLLCAALCWMLQGWMPPKYSLIGGVLAAMQLGVTGYWINGYWGGAVAGIGGALATGALPRLARRPTLGAAVAAAAALPILANSRPFEGLIFIVLWGIALLWWARRCRTRLFRAAVVVPLAAGTVLTLGFTAYYNWRTTGDPRLMPYVRSSREYHMSPPLWILPAASRPTVFRDSSLERLWQWDHDIHVKVQQNPFRALGTMGHGVFITFVDGAGLALTPFFVGGLLLISSFRVRMAAVLLVTFVCLLMSEQFVQSHYMAPGLGLLVLVLMFGLQLFRTMKVRRLEIGLPVVAGILLFSVSLCLAYTLKEIVDTRHAPLTPLRFRARVLEQLSAKPGRHLVMVRYAPDHDFLIEHVYNGPDIDAQRVVWALDRGAAEDRALFAYYPDRMVWLYQPDGPSPSITRWPVTRVSTVAASR